MPIMLLFYQALQAAGLHKAMMMRARARPTVGAYGLVR